MNDPTVDKALAATRQLNPQGLYSHAAEQSAALPQAKGTPQQMLAAMKGVKPEEMANSGAQQAFAGQPSVTREQLAQHFQQAMPKLQETELGERAPWADPNEENPHATKYEEYTIPSGDNYRELLMHAPDPRDVSDKDPEVLAAHATVGEAARAYHAHRREHGYGNPAFWHSPETVRLNTALNDAQRAHQIAAANAAERARQNVFTSSHWDQPNVVAHLRMSDRRDPTDPEGGKLLHLEELQSDWGQAGREKGFKDPSKPFVEQPFSGNAEIAEIRNRIKHDTDTDEDFSRLRQLQSARDDHETAQKAAKVAESQKVPHGPYVTSTNGWVDLGLKRALHEAARGDYSRLAWTPGAEQADRYGLHKKLSHLAYHPGVQRLLGTKHGANHPAIEKNDVTPENLPAYVGKELAEKLLASERDANGAHSLEGDDLKVGGEGMKAFYDKLLPGRLKEIVRKLGHEAQIEPVTIKHGTRKKGEPHQTALHSLKLTPELKESILKGMPAYKQGGDVVDKALHVTAHPAKTYAAGGNITA